MRAIGTVAAILVSALAALAPAHAAVIDVLTGDVIRVEEREWRIANIDAPRVEHACITEVRVGLEAQAKLAEIVAQGELEIRPTGKRDLDRRRMAFMRINGEDVGEKMLATGLVQRQGKAIPLCATLNRSRRPDSSGGMTRNQQRPQSTPPAPVVGIRR
jgi:endonuclease YncB( thermonuclease family)